MNVLPRSSDLVGCVASPPLLELDHVSISYPTRDGLLTAVENVSFTLSDGERLVLLGPSGCGKSTLLRAVGGFLKSNAGEIRLNGQPVGAPGPDRMTVFQEFDQLLPWRTVLGNVRYALERGKSLPRPEAESVARHWLNRVGLKNFADSYPPHIVGRDEAARRHRARLRSGASLAADGRAVCSTRCTHAAANAGRTAQGLCQDTGSTALFVTHGIDEAIRVGTRILALTPHPGRLAATFDVPPGSRVRGTAAFAELERLIQQSVFADPETERA